MSEQVTPFNPAEIKEMSVAYQSFVAEARALPKEELISLRADPVLAYDNVKTACKNLFTEANISALQKKSVSDDRLKKMQRAPEIAQAVIYAHLEAERAALRDPTDTSAKIARASHLRKAHLLLAESLVLFDFLKENEVKQIAEGPGLGVDLANDCIRLADLFTRNDITLASKIPTTPALLTEMSKLGSELVGVIRPTDAAPKSADASEAWRGAQDVRDRLWTMLDQCYDLLVSAGIELVGRRKVDQLVPPLQSRAASKKT